MEKNRNIVQTFTEMAPRYTKVVDTELNRFWGWSYPGFIKMLLSKINLSADDIILDVATGTGVIPSLLEERGHPGNQIHGLDITYAMLRQAKNKFGGQNAPIGQRLVCASAMEMPYADAVFSQVICGLASHHMDVKSLTSESYRILGQDGKLTIADIGGSNLLEIPVINFIARVFAFFYFVMFENIHRAWAETKAVSNVLSRDGWSMVLQETGFKKIVIQELVSKYFWVPAPLLIMAEKKE